MSPQLPADCLKEIFELLNDDIRSLHSSINVSKLWCKIGIQILWRHPWKFTGTLNSKFFWPAIVKTLLSCMKDESLMILKQMGIDISISNNKSPMFNYAGYCKYLSPWEINRMVMVIQGRGWWFESNDMSPVEIVIEQELYKLFMSRCSTLKHLIIPKARILTYPGATMCLSQLSALECSTSIPSTFFKEMAQYCHNLQRLIVEPCDEDVEGLAVLITKQTGLREVELVPTKPKQIKTMECHQIGKALVTQATSLKSLYIQNYLCFAPELLASFVNLVTLRVNICVRFHEGLSSSMSFPQLETLEIFEDKSTPFDYYTKVIESTGGNLEKIYFNNVSHADDQELRNYIHAITFCCQNIRLVTIVLSNKIEIDELEQLLESCQKIEVLKLQARSLKIIDGERILQLLAVKAPRSLTTLNFDSERPYGCWLFSYKALDEFLNTWKVRNMKPLSIYFEIACYEPGFNAKHYKIIKKYLNEGVLKEFYEINNLCDPYKKWQCLGPWG
ncbi:7025_t:CDS:1 [Dentiscutata erythropus]|uniref:7025_t:CDS:1 n=1 Tax=Dentiscutata erythropus TaxID=1348616 RepID=A0A9N9HVN4_9GLOM|nr:7025_t:CDS:1 [Dentiscutata erythropus]